LSRPTGGLFDFFLETFSISCGELVEQVKTLRIGIWAIWKFEKLSTEPPIVDTREPFYDSHHKIAFDYDEYTISLVEEPTLTTSKVSLSNNSGSFAGNASIALDYYYYEIEADAP
jgi:hypothetical protein